MRCDDVSQAAWIQARVAGPGQRVQSILPTGFPAYVRVLHPAELSPPELRPVRWAEVAERAGVTMHASIDFDGRPGPHVGPQSWNLSEPWTGSLDPEPLAALCDVLARHTTSPARCWFGIWDGYGWLHPASIIVATFTAADGPEDAASAAVQTEPVAPVMGLTWNEPAPPAPLFELPWREYRLLSGPLDAALGVGSVLNGVFFPWSPSLIWPDDHASCVATDVDLRSTYVAASVTLADELLADPRLEAWPAQPDDPLS